MTVSDISRRQAYTGNGVTTAFDFPFKYFQSGDVVVSVNGTVVVTGYTLTANASGVGGTITFSVAPVNAAAILIYGDLDYTQASPVPVVDKQGRGLLEAMADKAVILIQQLKRLLIDA